MIAKCVLSVFILLCATAPVRAQSACEKVIISADPAYPPLHWFDGDRLRGASIVIAERVLDEMHLPHEVRYVGPLKRVLALARTGGVDMVVTLKITDERKSFLLFGQVPALENPIAVFVPAAMRFDYAGWPDLVGRKGVVAAGNEFGGGFDDYMHRHLTVITVSDLSHLFLMLKFHRADYILTGRYSGLAWLAANRESGQFVPLKTNVVSTSNYVAFSRESPCAQRLPEFDRQLRRLKARGVFDQVIEQSLADWNRNPME
jgi:polar amino acid transport system substrate-binding protein